MPVDVVTATTADTIELNCSKAEVEKMDPFVQTEYIEEQMPQMYQDYGSGYYGMGTLYYWPYASYGRTVRVPVKHPQIPPGEVVVRRGTRLEATDGFVGKVDEFLVNSENSHVTHFVYERLAKGASMNDYLHYRTIAVRKHSGVSLTVIAGLSSLSDFYRYGLRGIVGTVCAVPESVRL